MKIVMSKIIAIVLIVVGAFLVVWGYNESQSLGSHLNRMFSGTATQQTLIYYISGAVCLLLGMIGLVRK